MHVRTKEEVSANISQGLKMMPLKEYQCLNFSFEKGIKYYGLVAKGWKINYTKLDQFNQDWAAQRARKMGPFLFSSTNISRFGAFSRLKP